MRERSAVLVDSEFAPLDESLTLIILCFLMGSILAFGLDRRIYSDSRNLKGGIDLIHSITTQRIYNSRNLKGGIDNFIIGVSDNIYNSRNLKGGIDVITHTATQSSTIVEI